MDIQALKLELVNKIIHTEKQSLLVKINGLLQDDKSEDWWDLLPPEVRDSILEGMDDISEGNVFSHEQVIREAKQKYGF
jgi:hypothetical protein